MPVWTILPLQPCKFKRPWSDMILSYYYRHRILPISFLSHFPINYKTTSQLMFRVDNVQSLKNPWVEKNNSCSHCRDILQMRFSYARDMSTHNKNRRTLRYLIETWYLHRTDFSHIFSHTYGITSMPFLYSFLIKITDVIPLNILLYSYFPSQWTQIDLRCKPLWTECPQTWFGVTFYNYTRLFRSPSFQKQMTSISHSFVLG